MKKRTRAVTIDNNAIKISIINTRRTLTWYINLKNYISICAFSKWQKTNRQLHELRMKLMGVEFLKLTEKEAMFFFFCLRSMQSERVKTELINRRKPSRVLRGGVGVSNTCYSSNSRTDSSVPTYDSLFSQSAENSTIPKISIKTFKLSCQSFQVSFFCNFMLGGLLCCFRIFSMF